MHRSLPIRLLLVRLVVVCALLFSQLGGLTHGIAHTLAEQSHDQSLPHDRLCDLCASYAQLGAALGSFAVPFVAAEQHISFVSPVHITFFTTSFTAFAARAPPYSA